MDFKRSLSFDRSNDFYSLCIGKYPNPSRYLLSFVLHSAESSWTLKIIAWRFSTVLKLFAARDLIS